jgi:hypothetical protein
MRFKCCHRDTTSTMTRASTGCSLSFAARRRRASFTRRGQVAEAKGRPALWLPLLENEQREQRELHFAGRDFLAEILRRPARLSARREGGDEHRSAPKPRADW